MPELTDEIARLADAGHEPAQIAEMLGISLEQVADALIGHRVGGDDEQMAESSRIRPTVLAGAMKSTRSGLSMPRPPGAPPTPVPPDPSLPIPGPPKTPSE